MTAVRGDQRGLDKDLAELRGTAAKVLRAMTTESAATAAQVTARITWRAQSPRIPLTATAVQASGQLIGGIEQPAGDETVRCYLRCRVAAAGSVRPPG